MNITVLAVGTKMPRWVDEAVSEYAKRFGRDINYALKEIKPESAAAALMQRKGWPQKKNVCSKPFQPALI